MDHVRLGRELLFALACLCVAACAGGSDSQVDLKQAQQALDEDSDHDGVIDVADNCPLVSNGSQTNTNGVGPGDACELSLSLSDGYPVAWASSAAPRSRWCGMCPSPCSGHPTWCA